jgi:hypothetical protein
LNWKRPVDQRGRHRDLDRHGVERDVAILKAPIVLVVSDFRSLRGDIVAKSPAKLEEGGPARVMDA